MINHHILDSAMSVTQQRLQQTELAEFPVTIRNAGVAGAGGAGFPSHAKWQRIEEVDHLLVNHQESEPNYYVDKWLGKEKADELATLFDALLDRAFETIVIGAKEKDRDEWMGGLESSTDGTVYGPEDLPLDPETESGVVFAYTDDTYQYGMESVLLNVVADVVVGSDLPMDHGWIVQNTETMYNVYGALEDATPVTRTYVHVDGKTPRHRFLEVPIGTPAAALLTAADLPPAHLDDDDVLLDGGPGWCFEIDRSVDAFGVRKRTNCVLVLDGETVAESTLGNDRVNVLDEREWRASVDETEPTARLSPAYVRVPLITNPAFEGVVQPSEPIVESGETVSEGEMIARPAGEISNAQHAPIDGEVTTVTDTHVEIHREHGRPGVAAVERVIYWTWCGDCGTYVVYPETAGNPDPTRYVCEDCRRP